MEERRNRQDLIEVFKMYKGFTRLSIDELFKRDVNIKGTRGHTLRLKKKQSVGDVMRYFFFTESGEYGIVWTRKQWMWVASTHSRAGLIKLEKQGWVFMDPAWSAKP